MRYGWNGRRLVVDLSARESRKEPIDDEWLHSFLGGRGINSRALYDEVGPSTDPLGEGNALILGVGPVNGTLIPGSGRLTFTALSPMTVVAGGKKPCFGDSNVGGFLGAELKFAGYDQVVIRGRARDPVYLYIHDDRVEIREAKHLWGLDTWQTTAAIQQELGDQVQVACIGPAGENLVRYACIIVNLARAAGKCGLGAVMGSKHLKAIAVRGTQGVKVARPREMQDLVQEAVRVLYSDPSSRTYSRQGTPSILRLRAEAGGLPTMNFQKGAFERWQEVTADALEAYWTKSKACFGCSLHCSHYYQVNAGPHAGTKGEGLEWGILGNFGPILGNADLPAILHADLQCNKLGIGATITGSTVGWAMECWQKGLLGPGDTDGLPLEWGDSRVILELVNRIAFRKGKLGDLLAEGSYRAAQVVGRGSEYFASQVKGQPPGMADARLSPAWGLSYLVASRGGDHLRALVVGESFFTPEEAEKMFGSREAVQAKGVRGKGRLVKWSEDQRAAADSLEVCKFVVRTILCYPRWITSFFNVVTGLDYSEEEVMRAGERINNVERAFNVRQGLTRADDMINERFLREPLNGRTFDPRPLLDEYYEARGWDLATGYPLGDTLERLGLKDVARDLKSHGIRLPWADRQGF